MIVLADTVDDAEIVICQSFGCCSVDDRTSLFGRETQAVCSFKSQ
jgi:hypothetical protein